MSLPILIEENENGAHAALLGAPDVAVDAPTREEAIDSLKALLSQTMLNGALIELDLGHVAVSDLAGKYRDDPCLREISDEAFRLRDADSAE